MPEANELQADIRQHAEHFLSLPFEEKREAFKHVLERFLECRYSSSSEAAISAP